STPWTASRESVVRAFGSLAFWSLRPHGGEEALPNGTSRPRGLPAVSSSSAPSPLAPNSGLRMLPPFLHPKETPTTEMRQTNSQSRSENGGQDKGLDPWVD